MVGPIKVLVRSHIEGSTLLSNVGAEVSFQLPSEASASFKNMLLEMEDRQTELGISRWVLTLLLLSLLLLLLLMLVPWLFCGLPLLLVSLSVLLKNRAES